MHPLLYSWKILTCLIDICSFSIVCLSNLFNLSCYFSHYMIDVFNNCLPHFNSFCSETGMGKGSQNYKGKVFHFSAYPVPIFYEFCLYYCHLMHDIDLVALFRLHGTQSLMHAFIYPDMILSWMDGFLWER